MNPVDRYRRHGVARIVLGLLAPMVLSAAASECAFVNMPKTLKFVADDGEESELGCAAEDDWTWHSQSHGRHRLFLATEGPAGSGRYWRLAIGLGAHDSITPAQFRCIDTETLGWRSLRSVPPGWPINTLHDVDADGQTELLIGRSFALRDQPSPPEHGLMIWVYRWRGRLLRLDLRASRKAAEALARHYRVEPLQFDSLMRTQRRRAAHLLEQFARGECPLISPAATTDQ